MGPSRVSSRPLPLSRPPECVEVDSRNCELSCDLCGGGLIAHALARRQVLHSGPRLADTPTGESIKSFSGDRVERKLEGHLGEGEVELGRQIRVVQAVTKEDVEDLARKSPAPRRSRQLRLQILGLAVEGHAKGDRAVRELPQVQPREKAAGSGHGAGIAGAANGGCADGHPRSASLNCRKELVPGDRARRSLRPLCRRGRGPSHPVAEWLPARIGSAGFPQGSLLVIRATRGYSHEKTQVGTTRLGWRERRSPSPRSGRQRCVR